jgi:hypothetical protein
MCKVPVLARLTSGPAFLMLLFSVLLLSSGGRCQKPSGFGISRLQSFLKKRKLAGLRIQLSGKGFCLT